MARARNNGSLVISLDFELFWGMFDKVSLDAYGPNVLGERTAIPRMLDLFKQYEIHATWATVGMLMAHNKNELLSYLPPSHLRPIYENMNVSSYEYLRDVSIGDDEASDPYHFGSSLVKMILTTPHQKIGNHTFSHFYCIDGHKMNVADREGGLGHENDSAIFARDLEAHRAISLTYGIEATSTVFPRNQADETALRTCANHGITSYRGNEDHVLYRPRKDREQSPMVRAFRLLDHYINISGHHTYRVPQKVSDLPLNVPASRFLRPWNKPLRFFEPLRLLRIKRAMTHAAKNGEIFHLWWHPHNFGINQEQNFKNLEVILKHFTKLREQYGFESASMEDIAKRAFEPVA